MQIMSTFEMYLAPAGRIIVGAYFLLAGLGKVADVSGTAGYIASVGFPAASALAVLAILIEVGLGLALIVGFRAKLAALLLAGFVLFISFPFHGPQMWAENPMQQISFMKNMALMGGLIFMAAHAGIAATLAEPKSDAPTPTL